MTIHTIGPVLYSFFEDHLKRQNGLSEASVKSYRDALRLFLQFMAQDSHKSITRLSCSDFTADRVSRFLNNLEDSRHNQIGTRNQRLAALRTFFAYLAHRVPETLTEAERVAIIATKRTAPPQTFFLQRDEIDTLFARLPGTGRFALRDRVLLLFLYNTGARVQEAAILRATNLELNSQPRVHLHGKGNKWRVCPLWTETASLLKQLLEQQAPSTNPDPPVFTSHHGQALTRFGIYKIVRRHTRSLVEKREGTERQRISPHTFRHTTAVHLLEAGVEVNVIRGWLGHVSLETTNRYAEISLRAKQAALKACDPPAMVSEKFPRKPAWQDDPSLLKWLQSL